MSRRRSGSRPKAPAPDFWGEAAGPGEGLEAGPRIRPSSDPAALARSLGAPPLAMSSAVAMGSLTAIYEEAVRAAGALAASCGLLAEDDAGG